MSTYQGLRTVSRIAGSNISPYRFVVFASGDSKYDHVGSAQGEMDGISAEGGVGDGEAFPMIVPDGGIAKVVAGAAVSVGDVIASDNQGRAITAVSGAGNFTAGKALTAADAAGDIIEIQFWKDRDQA